MSVSSQFFDPESDELRINTLDLISFTSTEFEIQITFKSTAYISQSLTNPDIVTITFKQSDLFVDADSYMTLEPNFVMQVSLPPQVTLEEAAQLEQMNEDVEGPMKYLSIVQTIGNLAMAYGLKYLWNMVNLFQFLIFFKNWKIAISPEAQIALDQLKKLAFFEFIETQWFTDWVKHDVVGQEKKCSEEDEECEVKTKRRNRLLRKNQFGDLSDAMAEEGPTDNDADRLGSNDIIENMGIMLLFAFVLLVVCICLIGIAMFVKYNPEVYFVFEKIKRKIFWNAFLRYVLQSTLKSQVGAGAVMAVTVGLSKEHQAAAEEESPSSLMAKLSVPAGMLIFFNIAPIIFYCILKKNKTKLASQESRSKYGQMYECLDVDYALLPTSVLGQVQAKKSVPSWDTLSQPIVFLLRRSIFVFITFGLFNYPGIQINVFIYSSILYIIYITHYPKYNPIAIMWTEVINESIFLLICYHMVLFSNLVWKPSVKFAVGVSMIGCLVTLLFGNTMYIAQVSMRAAKINKRTKYIKNRHTAIMKERKTALDALKSAGILNQTMMKHINSTEFKENRLVYAHERRKIMKTTHEQIKNIIVDKYGKDTPKPKEVEELDRMTNLELNETEMKMIQLAYPQRKFQLFKLFNERKNDVKDEESPCVPEVTAVKAPPRRQILTDHWTEFVPRPDDINPLEQDHRPHVKLPKAKTVELNSDKYARKSSLAQQLNPGQQQPAKKQTSRKMPQPQMHDQQSIELEDYEEPAEPTNWRIDQRYSELQNVLNDRTTLPKTSKEKRRRGKSTKQNTQNFEGGCEEEVGRRAKSLTRKNTNAESQLLGPSNSKRRELVPVDELEDERVGPVRPRRNPKEKKIRGQDILEQMRRVDNANRKLKPVTSAQKKRALEFVRAVTHLKTFNSKAIRNHEFISNYEQKVLDECSSSDNEPKDKEILPEKSKNVTVVAVEGRGFSSESDEIGEQVAEMIESESESESEWEDADIEEGRKYAASHALQMIDQDLLKCQKRHELIMVYGQKDLPQYKNKVNCDECGCSVNLVWGMNPKGGLQHCESCKYNICRECAFFKMWKQAHKKSGKVSKQQKKEEIPAKDAMKTKEAKSVKSDSKPYPQNKLQVKPQKLSNKQQNNQSKQLVDKQFEQLIDANRKKQNLMSSAVYQYEDSSEEEGKPSAYSKAIAKAIEKEKAKMRKKNAAIREKRQKEEEEVAVAKQSRLVTIVESDDEKRSWTSAEEKDHSYNPKQKKHQEVLSDNTIVNGYKWSYLKVMLSNPKLDSKQFFNKLTKPEQKLIAKLDAIQAKQGDMKPLRKDVPRLEISDSEI